MRERPPYNGNLPHGCTDRDIERAAVAPEPEEPNGTGYDPVAMEDKAARRKAWLQASLRILQRRSMQTDYCPNCIAWGGSDNDSYGYCGVIRMETSDTATCTRFEAKADINANADQP